MATLTSEMKGGSALARHLREIARRLGDGVSLRVGFLEDAKYPDGTPVAQVAMWSEYGTSTSPPRPFIRNMVVSKSPRWGHALGRIVRDNDYDAVRSLSLMGEGIKGQLQQSIQDFTDPPLAQSTIDRKGFSKPLIDTSVMWRSVDFQVTSDKDSF